MGVPDLRGGLGTTTFYTTERRPGRARARTSCIPSRPGADEVFSTHLIGPRNPKDGQPTCAWTSPSGSIARGSRIVIRSDGTPKELEVRQGAWSDWLRVKFKLGMLQSVRGMVRFHLIACEPELALYASPVNFDPDSPLFPISEPFEYASDLARDIGLYYTTGMVEDHTGLEQRADLRAAFSRPVRDRLARARGHDARRAGVVRRRAVLLPVRHARPHSAPVLAVPRARPPGQPGRAARSELRLGHRRRYRRCDAMVGRALEYATTRHS